MTIDVAIVGAGAAGVSAAYALRESDTNVTVFEKSGGVCGRAATRRQNGCLYDHGANYIKSDSNRVSQLITETLSTEGLVDITEPIWVFDDDGEISEGRAADEHKWTYEAGITQLGKRLLDQADATVHQRTRIAQLNCSGGGWQLEDEDGANLGRFDRLLLTPPAPQTADLLGCASWEGTLCRDIREEIEAIPYRTIISVLLHYPFEIDRPYYGLVNMDKNHDIGWLSREECKTGHIPDGESLLVVQMAPDWSIEHYDIPEAELTDAVATRVATLLDDDSLANPDWTDTQHWRYAQPDEKPDRDLLDQAGDHDLFFAGDWLAGAGRVHLAVESGLEAAERITS